MSYAALQRVVVRLLYDPAFVARLHDDPEALQGVPVTATEREWLLAVDRRAWAADDERAARSLAGLSDEYPASLSLLMERQVDALGFFSSPAFHACIQEGRSLALTFGDWLTDDAPIRSWSARNRRRFGVISAIERAVAILRRREARPVGEHMALSPNAWVLTTDTGALGAYQAVMAGKRPLPPLAGVCGMLLLENGQSGVTIEALNNDLGVVLGRATTPVSRELLLDVTMSRGLSRSEASDVLDDLASDGLLVYCAAELGDPGEPSTVSG